MGVDLERFPSAPAGEGFVCVGSLTERKNVLRLASAFERLGEGTLTFVGDGPLRPQLEGRAESRSRATSHTTRSRPGSPRARVLCAPSLVEPFGQAILEGLASGRPVVATKIGGPPEFVPPEAGVLVDPGSEDDIVAGLRRAAELPCPNEAAPCGSRRARREAAGGEGRGDPGEGRRSGPLRIG